MLAGEQSGVEPGAETHSLILKSTVLVGMLTHLSNIVCLLLSLNVEGKRDKVPAFDKCTISWGKGL